MLDTKILLKLQQSFKCDYHEVYTEEINKISLSSNDDKRLQTYDRIKTHPMEQVLLKYVKVKC